MRTTSSAAPEIENVSAGAAWIHRFLLPHLASHFPNQNPLSCLQLWPDDAIEAEELHRLGHRCDMLDPTPETTLPCDSGTCDFAFTGRFPARVKDRATRIHFAKELFRVLNPGGALLLVLGNRLCPIDLSRNGPFLHGPFAGAVLSLNEAKQIFLHEARFNSLNIHNPTGHFAWQRAPAAIRPLGNALEHFWHCAARRPSLYNSIFNPTLILWLTKT